MSQEGRDHKVAKFTRQHGLNEAFFSTLAASLYRQGKLDEAIIACRKVIAINPDLAEAHANLGVALFDQGKLDEAIDAYRHAIKIKPNYAEAHSNFGVVLYRQGKIEKAIDAQRQAIQINPNYAEAYFNLGNALVDLGNLDEAIAAYGQVIQINPDHAEAYSNLGNTLCAKGRLSEAVDAFRQAIRIHPGYAEALSNLGAALRLLGKLDESVTTCRDAIIIKPTLAEAHCNLGIALNDQGKFSEAIASYREAIRLKPNYFEAHCNLGTALFEQGNLDDGAAAYRQAIGLNPKFAEAHYNLGLALVQFGKPSEARAALEQAIQLEPSKAKYHRILGDITRFVDGDPDLEEMERLARSSLSDGDQIELHFALAKAYDDLGQCSNAFRHWFEGNTLKRLQITYNEATTLELLDYARTAFTPDLIRTWKNAGDPSIRPVFIVGMMRSGSTLVEQILASHPQVFGGGEFVHFRRAVEETRTILGAGMTLPELASVMTDQDFRDLGQRYLAKIESMAPPAIRITDKTLGNFIATGLIHLALPNAPIIHTFRDPIDTCLSCYSKLFSTEQNHTYDLGELGRYYKSYQALMAHWHNILPRGRILDVRYEDVVADLEGQARRIIAYCGLDWDPRCLAFYETQRPVRTYSAMQVRQQIYNNAIGRWHRYSEFLGPLLAELVP